MKKTVAIKDLKVNLLLEILDFNLTHYNISG